jgi:hypothetical protein
MVVHAHVSFFAFYELFILNVFVFFFLLHPFPAFGIGHFFDGVTQGGAWHLMDVLAKEGT